MSDIEKETLVNWKSFAEKHGQEFDAGTYKEILDKLIDENMFLILDACIREWSHRINYHRLNEPNVLHKLCCLNGKYLPVTDWREIYLYRPIGNNITNCCYSIIRDKAYDEVLSMDSQMAKKYCVTLFNILMYRLDEDGLSKLACVCAKVGLLKLLYDIFREVDPDDCYLNDKPIKDYVSTSSAGRRILAQMSNTDSDEKSHE